MGTVLLPIETKARELFGKVWLARNLSNNGHTVVIGERPPIYDRCIKFSPDVLIEKSSFHARRRLNRTKSLQRHNSNIVYLDEEGVFSSVEEYFQKCSAEQLRLFDHIFAWGRTPANALTKTVQYPPEDITITGNPRFDLLNKDLRHVYKKGANEVSNRYGEFVLINTNFTRANYYRDLEIKKEWHEKNDIEYNEGLTKYDKELVEKFIDLIHNLLQNDPDWDIILRPHPSESHSVYLNEFEGTNKVNVEYSGDVREWILASNAVIQNSCTTGIESALLNIPTFSFDIMEYSNMDLKPDLPNKVSMKFYDIENLTEAVFEYVEQDREYKIPDDDWRILKEYFHNIDNNAAPEIANTISEIIDNSPDPQYDGVSNTPKSIRELKKSKYGSAVKSVIRKITGESPADRKFEGITEEEIKSISDMFEEIVDLTPVSIEKDNRWEDVYWISPDR